jgi:hypothetical protein
VIAAGRKARAAFIGRPRRRGDRRGREHAETHDHRPGSSRRARLGAEQSAHDLGPVAPRFDLFLDTLLRGLPARTPVEHPR